MPNPVHAINEAKGNTNKIDMDINPLCELISAACKISDYIEKNTLRKIGEMHILMDEKASLLDLRKDIKIDDKELSEEALNKIEHLRKQNIEIPQNTPSDAREYIDSKTRELGSSIDRGFREIEISTKDGQLINNTAQSSIRENPNAQIVRNQRS